MVKVDASVTEQGCDSRKVGFFAVDVVFARVVLESLSGDDEFGVRDNLVATTRLHLSV